MAYSLAQAAAAVGRSRSTVLRAIQTGRVSAVRDDASGTWLIEPVELHRAYPVAPAPADRHGERTDLIAAKDALISEQRGMIDDLRRRLDRAEEERQRLTLLLEDHRRTDSPPRRRWWPWRR